MTADADVMEFRGRERAEGERGEAGAFTGAGNAVLASLPQADRAALAPHLTRVSFAVGDVIARAGDSIETICFFESGIAGIIDALDGERRYAVGVVGAEGYVGWPALLGEARTPWEVVMRAECGHALTMPAPVLVAAMAQRPALRAACLGFVHAFMAQVSKATVSALAHPVDRRMARWILLYHDRLRDDDICMTHEEFRLMLGARRSSVTDALLRLQDEGAIRSMRGRVVVRDRAVLMRLAGDTYQPAAGHPIQDEVGIANINTG